MLFAIMVLSHLLLEFGWVSSVRCPSLLQSSTSAGWKPATGPSRSHRRKVQKTIEGQRHWKSFRLKLPDRYAADFWESFILHTDILKENFWSRVKRILHVETSETGKKWWKESMWSVSSLRPSRTVFSLRRRIEGWDIYYPRKNGSRLACEVAWIRTVMK